MNQYQSKQKLLKINRKLIKEAANETNRKFSILNIEENTNSKPKSVGKSRFGGGQNTKKSRFGKN